MSFPLLNPYGHVAFQAQRGDVHTVVVDGRVVKFAHRLVDTDLGRARTAVTETVEYLQSEMGEPAWAAGMNPDLPSRMTRYWTTPTPTRITNPRPPARPGRRSSANPPNTDRQ